VIIRLCATAGENGAPLGDPSMSNAVLSHQINDWFKLTQRIYIWNYVAGE
jgi:hypothetical protein